MESKNKENHVVFSKMMCLQPQNNSTHQKNHRKCLIFKMSFMFLRRNEQVFSRIGYDSTFSDGKYNTSANSLQMLTH